jgi:hypothetical protein
MLSNTRLFWQRGGFSNPEPGEKPLLCKLGWHILYTWHPSHGRELYKYTGSCGRKNCDRRFH